MTTKNNDPYLKYILAFFSLIVFFAIFLIAFTLSRPINTVWKADDLEWSHQQPLGNVKL